MRIRSLTAAWIGVVMGGMVVGHVGMTSAQERSDRTAAVLKTESKTEGTRETGESDPTLMDMAAEFAAQIAADLGLAGAAVEAGSMLQDPRSVGTLFSFKVIDETGDVTAILFDRRGTLLSTDPNAWLDAHLDGRSPIHPDLDEAMKASLPGDRLEVTLWCRLAEGGAVPERMEASDPVAEKDNAKQAVRPELERIPDIVDEQVEPDEMAGVIRVAQRLGELGIQFELAADAPMIYASLTTDEIQTMSQHEDVLDCYLASTYAPSMATSRQVLRAHTVNNRGITGSGVRVGVIEVGGRINYANPWLSGVQRVSNTCLDNHASMVAGVIASRHGTHRGIAPNALIYSAGSCRGRESELRSATEAAKNWGVRIINNSWNNTSTSRVPNGLARYLDRIVGVDNRLVVQSAGNTGNLTRQVPNPATFYNGLTVGSFDDRGTVSTWDDRMSSFSATLNPISMNSDRVKPEIAAPGSNITTLKNTSSWLVTGSGTSFAAPAVSGTAALMMQRNSNLRSWPETTKAILMATALLNIEGDARLSTADGAGGVQADRADDVTRGFRGGWNGLNYTQNSSTNRNVRTMYLTAGRRTRVVLAWNQDTNYSRYAERPAVDLDLQILRPNGSVQAGSYSWDNTYEIVDFTPTVSGWHTIRVRRHRTSGSINGIGVAWYQP